MTSRIDSPSISGAYFSGENTAPVAPAAAPPPPAGSSSSHAIRSGGQNLERFVASMNTSGSEPPSPDVTTEAGRDDRLSALPRDLHAEVARRLSPRGWASLARSGPEMAASLRRPPETGLDARPRYDPTLEFGAVHSHAELRSALDGLASFPFPADENRGDQVARGLGELAQRIPHLPEDERLGAFSDLLHRSHQLLQGSHEAPIRRAMAQIGSLPMAQRSVAFHALLQTHAAGGTRLRPAHDAEQRALDDQAWRRQLSQTISQLPEGEVAFAITQASGLEAPGNRLSTEMKLNHALLALLPEHAFQLAYEAFTLEIARRPDGGRCLELLAQELRDLPDGPRRMAFRALTQAAPQLDDKLETQSVLVRLVLRVGEQPHGEQYLSSLDVLTAAEALGVSQQLTVVQALGRIAHLIGTPGQAQALHQKCGNLVTELQAQAQAMARAMASSIRMPM